MTVTVLVPDNHGFEAVSRLEGACPLRYTLGEPLPAGADAAEVLVPTFLAGGPEHIELARSLPKLRLVQLLTAGAEAWVGKLPGDVMISTGRGAHGASTAEWTITGLLSVYREFTGFAIAQREHRWTQHRTDTLHGKRILIIGAGDLATELQRMLLPFDTTVELVGTYAREGVHGVDEIPTLLPHFDAAVLMVPVTSSTIGMVDAEFLSRMPDNAILVNAARGPVVRTDDLLAELESGRLRAVLDVTDPEPLPADHPLWDAPGLLLTPHVGGSSNGNLKRGWAIATAEIARYLAGEPPKNLVHGEY
ncbi:2-hydroxyacid dehydrogenase [Nocardia seriolae]|uniref:Glyoxylate/hydroxypyruvate reductase n=2 Tax=Nocardia seriolae TaxID=37332 RepID=A0A0B8NQ15_9NOCA|nr:2-hydroxyacid dehydrogenase [Nocardia seriolae]APA99513.1 Glyoxylate/hydroxypyruvate reductase [Nocardia seriolae]MTJ73569.1 phosphoglycerate dehydrogenase [Nocardia seriolae]MTJ89086.1 phosphoglycerate dehydrogenase [Nocardia seriolae]MTK33065.1 phosphoglycerate dehydrogenase [Nocardia seriolae]MTK41001.1 phosphoglycerate dehydrogenase [Nocardia seriolae]